MRRRLKYILILIPLALMIGDAGTLCTLSPDISDALFKSGCLPDLDPPCINGSCLEGRQIIGCNFCDSSCLPSCLKAN